MLSVQSAGHRVGQFDDFVNSVVIIAFLSSAPGLVQLLSVRCLGSVGKNALWICALP